MHEEGRRSERRVAALSVDLMDRSKIAAAFGGATVVRSMSKLTELVAHQPMLVLVDLARVDDVATLTELVNVAGDGGRVIAFGSHVDDTKLSDAEAAGAEVLARSVFFRRLAAGTL